MNWVGDAFGLDGGYRDRFWVEINIGGRLEDTIVDCESVTDDDTVFLIGTAGFTRWAVASRNTAATTANTTADTAADSTTDSTTDSTADSASVSASNTTADTIADTYRR